MTMKLKYLLLPFLLISISSSYADADIICPLGIKCNVANCRNEIPAPFLLSPGSQNPILGYYHITGAVSISGYIYCIYGLEYKMAILRLTLPPYQYEPDLKAPNAWFLSPDKIFYKCNAGYCPIKPSPIKPHS